MPRTREEAVAAVRKLAIPAGSGWECYDVTIAPSRGNTGETEISRCFRKRSKCESERANHSRQMRSPPRDGEGLRFTAVSACARQAAVSCFVFPNDEKSDFLYACFRTDGHCSTMKLALSKQNPDLVVTACEWTL